MKCYPRLALPVLHSPLKRSLLTPSTVISKSSTQYFHPGRSDQCFCKINKSMKINVLSNILNSCFPGNGQTKVIYGCNKCPVLQPQKRTLFNWGRCWTQSYSSDGQNGEESVKYAGSCIPSALVGCWQ